MAKIGLWILVGAFAFMSAIHAMGSGDYIAYVVRAQARLGGWAILSALDIGFAAIGIAGAWVAMRRRAYRWAVLFLLMQLPIPTIIGASRCDTQASCRLIGWAALPPRMLD